MACLIGGLQACRRVTSGHHSSPQIWAGERASCQVADTCKASGRAHGTHADSRYLRQMGEQALRYMQMCKARASEFT